LVPFKLPNFAEVADVWKQLGTMKIELCIVTYASIRFRVRRHVVELESRYTTLSVHRDFKYSNQFLL
jgi:hypothetical protein